jgi:hypothetical protein
LGQVVAFEAEVAVVVAAPFVEDRKEEADTITTELEAVAATFIRIAPLPKPTPLKKLEIVHRMETT